MLSTLQAVNQYGTYSVWAYNLEIRQVSESHDLTSISTTDLPTVFFCFVQVNGKCITPVHESFPLLKMTKQEMIMMRKMCIDNKKPLCPRSL